MKRARFFPSWWCRGAWLPILTLLSSGLVAQTAENPGRDSLQPIPVPDAGQLGSGAQEQLVQARASLDGLLASADVAEGELAEAYGLLGRLYYVYDFGDLAKIAFANARSLHPDDYRWSYLLAALYRLEGDWKQVEENLRQVLEQQPDDLPSLIRLGEAQLELGQYELAMTTYQQVIDEAPELAAGYAGRGRLAYERGDYEQAIDDLSRALELQPTADSLHHRLGMAYRQQGDLDLARQHLRNNRGGYLRYPDPLVNSLGSLIQSSQVHFNAGVAAAKQQNWPEAVTQFRQAVEAQPEDSLSAYNLGLALLQTGERQEGTSWLLRSVELDPDFRNGHFNLAMLRAEEGDWEEAVVHLRETHRIDPEDRAAHLELATALSQLGRDTEAVEELEDLLTLHPRDPVALLNLGTLQVRLERHAAAVETYSRLLDVGGDREAQAVAHLQLGALVEAAGQSDEALAHYSSAIELDPYSADAEARLASALGRQGRFAEAAEHFDRVVALDANRIDAHFGRAMALILAEAYGAALPALEDSVSTHPQVNALRHAQARLLATCPDPSIRDGDRAVRLAQEVLQAESNLEHAQTLAMALAEVGRFEDAVRLQGQVVTEAERLEQVDLAAQARRRLASYERRQPIRAPWKGP